MGKKKKETRVPAAAAAAAHGALLAGRKINNVGGESAF